MKVRVGLAQIAPRLGKLDYNFAKIFGNIENAQSKLADIVVFPELATCGYLSQGALLEHREKGNRYLRKLLQETAKIYAVVGMVEETELGTLHNCALVVGHGGVIPGNTSGSQVTSYRKCYLPTYGMFEELRWFGQGVSVPIFSLKLAESNVRMGVIICEDLWQPLPARIASARGAQVIMVIASSPKTLAKPRIVDSLLRARAVENTTYMVFVNASGSQDMVNFWGGSKIVSPEGEILLEAKHGEEDLVVGEIDLYKELKVREMNPMLREERKEIIEDYLKAFEEMRRS